MKNFISKNTKKLIAIIIACCLFGGVFADSVVLQGAVIGAAAGVTGTAKGIINVFASGSLVDSRQAFDLSTAVVTVKPKAQYADGIKQNSAVINEQFWEVQVTDGTNSAVLSTVTDCALYDSAGNCINGSWLDTSVPGVLTLNVVVKPSMVANSDYKLTGASTVIAASYRVNALSSSSSVQTQQTAPSEQTMSEQAPAASTQTASSKKQTAKKDKKDDKLTPIKGKVTMKKFLLKYCIFGVYGFGKKKILKSNKDNGAITFPSMGALDPDGWLEHDENTNDELWKRWYSFTIVDTFPGRIKKVYRTDKDCINVMLDDFEKLSYYDRSVRVCNFMYGQVLDAAKKVNRKIKVCVKKVNLKGHTFAPAGASDYNID